MAPEPYVRTSVVISKHITEDLFSQKHSKQVEKFNMICTIHDLNRVVNFLVDSKTSRQTFPIQIQFIGIQ